MTSKIAKITPRYTDMQDDTFEIAGKKFNSRLLVGTGKYKDFKETKQAIKASGAEIVTVAVRRVNVSSPNEPMLQDYICPKEYTYLPNTAGCHTAKDAVRTLRLAREAGGWNLVKLEVLTKEKTLYPDVIETIEAAEALIKDGFDVMVYTNDDPIIAKKLEDIGCCAIMPLAAPIGSGLGVQNPLNIQLIVEQAKVPVLVDAGVGTASDASLTMELGCDGVLMNTAIAEAQKPILMARAMKTAVEAGRLAYLAGRMQKRSYGSASSPEKGLLVLSNKIDDNNKSYMVLTVTVIGIIAALRITYLFTVPFDLFFDEAQYWLWSQTPEWGYYSKPPIVAWTITITTTLFNNSEPFVRLGSPLFHSITSWFIYLSATHLYNKQIGFWSALTYLTLPAVTLSSSLISTDPALLCFWAISFYCFLKARDTNKLQWWLLAGFAAGLGMLSKYNMLLFLPSVLLALAFDPKHKDKIKQKEIWIACIVTLIMFIPNILWNYSHGFVSYLHTKDNVNLQKTSLFHPHELLEFLSAQFGILGPILTITFVVFLLNKNKKPLKEAHTLLSFIWPMLILISVISLLSRAHANWAAPIYITTTILVTAWLIKSHNKKWLVISLTLHIICAILFMYANNIFNNTNIKLSGKHTTFKEGVLTIKDPYKRVKGWKAMSKMVEEIASAHDNVIIISDERKIAAPLHYYINRDTLLNKQQKIVKWDMNGRIEDHYELIDNIKNYPNHNAIYVTRLKNPGIVNELAKRYKKYKHIKTITIPLYTDFEYQYDVYLLEKLKQ